MPTTFLQYDTTSLDQGFDMDRSTPATQIDGGNGN